jgi:hypothetical protein
MQWDRRKAVSVWLLWLERCKAALKSNGAVGIQAPWSQIRHLMAVAALVEQTEQELRQIQQQQP